AYFAADGSPYLFAAYRGWRTRVWDLGSGRPAWPYLPGRWQNLRGWRTTPGGRGLPLPRYRQPLPIDAVPDPDGTVAVVVPPGGDRFGWEVYPGGREKVLWHFDGFKGTSAPFFALSSDGTRLVARGEDPRRGKKGDVSYPPGTLL